MTTDDKLAISTRRRYLAMVGAGALSVGLAGCSTSSDSDGDSTPPGTATSTAAGDGTPTGPSGGSGQTAGLDPCLRPASASTCDSPVTVNSAVTEDTTWGGECDEYLVSGRVGVENGATLTIEAGTRVVFGQNASLEIEQDSALSAVGSCGSPIVFTGEQATRGYWNGIQFNEADQTLSELSYCIVEYGGGSRFTFSDVPASVTVMEGARVSITNSSIRESAGYGVGLDHDITVDTFTDNSVTANEDGAVYAYAQTVGSLTAANTYAGNDEDVVVLNGGTLTTDDELTWHGIDVPFRVVAGRNIDVNGHLTVAPGATVEFGQNAALRMQDNGPGRLTADGMDPETEAVDTITFTGEQQTRGYWQGIQFNGTDRTENVLQHCVVEYGGGSRFTFADVPATLVVMDGSRVRIDNTVIRESEGYGAQVDGSSVIDSFTQNTVTANDDGPLHVHPARAGELSDTSSYAGNDTDRVAVFNGTVPQGDDLTWEALDVPYYVLSGARPRMRANLTIDPGTTVEFGQDSALRIDEVGPGSLTAVGTDAMPITFTGEQQTRGYWQGIQFLGTNRTENQLHYCVVEYGGGSRFTFADVAANITLMEGSRLSLQNSTVRESAAYGIDVDNSTLDQSNNTITDNAVGAIEN